MEVSSFLKLINLWIMFFEMGMMSEEILVSEQKGLGFHCLLSTLEQFTVTSTAEILLVPPFREQMR